MEEINDIEEKKVKNTEKVTQPSLDFSKPLEPVDYETRCAALDALLLVHNKPMTYEKLAGVIGITVEEAEELVLSRKADYDADPKCGLQIAILETGVQLATKAKISQFIQRLDGQKMVSLSLPALETLSVIALKQPITKAEIEAIRGVNSDGVVSTLLEKKLVYISGEKQVIGKPRLYSTTQDFLYYFGMNSLKELPVPTIDISDALTPEGQKPEVLAEQKQIEKDFNNSQGFVPIEDNNNEMGKVSPDDSILSEVSLETSDNAGVISEATDTEAAIEELSDSESVGELEQLDAEPNNNIGE